MNGIPVQQKVGLRMIEELISIIISYTYYSSYLDFRKMLINFQRLMLPNILDGCLKIFNSITDQYRVEI